MGSIPIGEIVGLTQTEEYMTVADLIEKLKELPQHKIVCANSKNEGGYQMYDITEIHFVKDIGFAESKVCLD